MVKKRKKKPKVLSGRNRQYRPARGSASFILGKDARHLIAESLGLTGRQLQVVQCVLDGLDEPSIAGKLKISAHTVHSYMNRLYGKTGVHRRSELILRVFRIYLSWQAKDSAEDNEAMTRSKSAARLGTERGHAVRAARAAM